MSESKNSNAYGVGIITVIVGMAVAIIFYQSYYLPESLEKPSVDEHILHPSFPENIIEIILGSANEQQTDNSINLHILDSYINGRGQKCNSIIHTKRASSALSQKKNTL